MLPPGRPNRWNSGECSTFADALQRRYGGEIWAIYDPNEHELYHAFVVTGELAWDADGRHVAEKLKNVDVYNVDGLVCEPVTVSWLKSFHGAYYEPDVPEATAYMAAFPDVFPI